MSKVSPNYKNTVIYNIKCNNKNIKDSYIGYTTNFIHRQRQHKHNSIVKTNEKYNLKLYKVIRKNGGWDNWSMNKIEDFPCNNEDKALERENQWINKYKPTLNQD
jgi:hypothetical protein